MNVFLILYLFFCGSIFCYGKDKLCQIIFINESRDIYQGIFTVEGRSPYPYSAKTDAINQIMGRRLAIYDAMVEMSRKMSILKNYLGKDFQPKIDKFFVENTFVSDYKNLENEVHIFLEYLFICNKKEYKEIKKELKSLISIVDQKHKTFLKKYITKNFLKKNKHLKKGEFFLISKNYWTKLARFYSVMVDND